MQQVPRPQSQQSYRFWSVLLIIVASLGCIYFYVIPFLASLGPGKAAFDIQAEALKMALQVQQYRYNHKSRGNYGMAEIIITYQDMSKPSVYSSPIYEGFDSKGADKNKDHSERKAHEQFNLPTLTQLKSRGIAAKASFIYVIIFSQIQICKLCQADMRGWLEQYRRQVGTYNISLSVYDLTGNFNPNVPRKQWTVVVNEADIEEITIPFDVSPTPNWTPATQ